MTMWQWHLLVSCFVCMRLGPKIKIAVVPVTCWLKDRVGFSSCSFVWSNVWWPSFSKCFNFDYFRAHSRCKNSYKSCQNRVSKSQVNRRRSCHTRIYHEICGTVKTGMWPLSDWFLYNQVTGVPWSGKSTCRCFSVRQVSEKKEPWKSCEFCDFSNTIHVVYFGIQLIYCPVSECTILLKVFRSLWHIVSFEFLVSFLSLCCQCHIRLVKNLITLVLISG
jgi:hypothetical protein